MSTTAQREVVLSVSPADVLIDEPLAITVDGLSPGAKATLVAVFEIEIPGDGTMQLFGEATFEADDEGTIDPAEQAPIEGCYDGVREMGLIQFAGKVDKIDTSPPVDPPTEPVDEGHGVRLAVLVGDEIRATETVVRRMLTDGVEQIRVEDHDTELVGDLLVPSGDGPHPSVVFLGGSGGGIPTGVQAKLLASRGYAVLALGYFQPSDIGPDTTSNDRALDRLPEECVEVPLSYFERGIEWLADREEVRADSIAVFGGSIGSQPAVLLAARSDLVSAVAVFAPLAYAFPSFQHMGKDEKPAWLVDGEPYPFLPTPSGMRNLLVGLPWLSWYVGRTLVTGEVSFAPLYKSNTENAAPERREAAALPVEDADAPVLVLSGTDDKLGPSTFMGEQLIQRLDAHDYDHEYTHYSYADAGHLLSVPYTPVRGRAGEPLWWRFEMALGGTPEGYAHADIDSWERTLSFLDDHLMP